MNASRTLVSSLMLLTPQAAELQVRLPPSRTILRPSYSSNPLPMISFWVHNFHFMVVSPGAAIDLSTLCSLPLMTNETKLPAEIARLIQEQAVVSLGPWPRDLELFIFVSNAGWSCGLSPATQGSDLKYREGVLQIARELQGKYPAGSVKGHHPVG
jgi:hypothetical protein